MSMTHKNNKTIVSPTTEELIPKIYDCLTLVAQEGIYLETVTPPPLEDFKKFQLSLIQSNMPAFCALDGEKVVGWIDIYQGQSPRMSHRGFLGMGIIKKYRGLGIGTMLLKKAIEHAKYTDLEQIELSVYTTNEAAIKLYKKFGFREIGRIKHYRKYQEQYFDTIEMQLFYK
jgi:ribosomal protein S18 acetylase RimI-like enzyme